MKERKKLQETGELCPNCQRRDVLAVFERGGETFIACEVCDYVEGNPLEKLDDNGEAT